MTPEELDMSESTDAQIEAETEKMTEGQIAEHAEAKARGSQRRTVRGVLHGSIIRKQRGALLDQILVDALIELGKITYDDRKFFYAPRYFLTDHDMLNQQGKPFRLLSFKGQPKSLSMELRGHWVEVRATLDAWANGVGAHLLRPQVLSVSPEQASGHVCDSPRACGMLTLRGAR